MIRTLIIVFATMTISFCKTTITLPTEDLTLMTYNMRLDVAVDGENAWPLRKDFFIQQLKDISADIIGTQEGRPHQIEFIDGQLRNYNYIGDGRDGNNKGEYSAVFYNHNRLDNIESNTFWLSETPEKPSKGWDAAYSRICTYGLFRDKKSGKLFWVFNTHLDHKGEQSRNKSIELICKKIKHINNNNYPVVVMGDLNAAPDSEVIKLLSINHVDSHTASKGTIDATFNGFKHGRNIPGELTIFF